MESKEEQIARVKGTTYQRIKRLNTIEVLAQKAAYELGGNEEKWHQSWLSGLLGRWSGEWQRLYESVRDTPEWEQRCANRECEKYYTFGDVLA